MKAKRRSVGEYGLGVIRANNLSLGITHLRVSTSEILIAPGVQNEEAQPAPFLVSASSFAVLRVVKYLSLRFNL